jgi:hypothetical protein
MQASKLGVMENLLIDLMSHFDRPAPPRDLRDAGRGRRDTGYADWDTLQPENARKLRRECALGGRQGALKAWIDAGRHIQCSREALENRFGDVMRLFAVF